ncbi:Retrotransposon, unclassified-like protein [Sesbania bispinosa]|nr:Retrotransposon, unclassified-like protein [Sesbania bispinosa]
MGLRMCAEPNLHAGQEIRQKRDQGIEGKRACSKRGLQQRQSVHADKQEMSYTIKGGLSTNPRKVERKLVKKRESVSIDPPLTRAKGPRHSKTVGQKSEKRKIKEKVGIKGGIHWHLNSYLTSIGQGSISHAVHGGVPAASFRKFDGTSSTREHLMCFLDDLGVHRNNKELRLKEFSKSLSGKAFTWYVKLRLHSIKTWEELASKFCGKFLEEEGALHIMDLGRVKQKAGEGLVAFIKRYRDRALHCKQTLPEVDLVYGCIKNIEDGSKIFLSLGGRTTFAELMRKGADVAEAIKRQGKRTKDADNAYNVCTLEEREKNKSFRSSQPPRRLPLSKEKYDYPSYYMLHRTHGHTTLECWMIRHAFHKQVRAGKVLLPEKEKEVNDLHRRPLSDHGVNVIALSNNRIHIEEINEENDAKERELAAGLSKTRGFRIFFRKLGLHREAQQEAAKALVGIIKNHGGELGGMNAPLTRLSHSHASAIVFREPVLQGGKEIEIQGVRAPFEAAESHLIDAALFDELAPPGSGYLDVGRAIALRERGEIDRTRGKRGHDGEAFTTLHHPRGSYGHRISHGGGKRCSKRTPRHAKVPRGRAGREDSKVEAIARMKPPTNIKEAQQLVGKMGYIRHFIPTVGELVGPLCILLKERSIFTWTEEHKKTFDKIKQKMTSVCVMSPPVPKKSLRLYIAVTEQAISGLIAQEVEGQERPVYYWSRVLKYVETRYPKQECYCLTLPYAAKEYKHYFQAHTIEVMSKSDGIKCLLQNHAFTGRMSRIQRNKRWGSSSSDLQEKEEPQVDAKTMRRKNRRLEETHTGKAEAEDVIQKAEGIQRANNMHHAMCGEGGPSLYRRMQRVGLHWPSMRAHCREIQEACERCKDVRECFEVNPIEEDWRVPIKEYLEAGILTTEPREAEKLRKRAEKMMLGAEVSREAAIEGLEEDRLKAEDELMRHHKRLTLAYEKIVRPRMFHEGELVLKVTDDVMRGQHTSKWAPNWEGPYVVKEDHDNEYCILLDPEEECTIGPMNFKYVKKHYA